MSFWEALGRPERQALMEIAVECDFADGTEIFREGEQANRVIIIRQGRTKICVRQPDGRERVIAERGPGQLVGERGALEVKVRSATVVAQGTVHAWVVRTHDFAAFVGAYPHVLDIVERQVYWRLTETACGSKEVRRDSDADRPLFGSEGRPELHGRARSTRLNGENCTVLLTDVAGFGGVERTDADRLFVRRALFEAMQETFEESQIAWRECHWDDRGDGFLIVVPPRVASTLRILDSVPHRLMFKLRQHNRRSNEAGVIRLRLAVHVGPVISDHAGVSGDAIVHAARLLEAPAFKRALVTRAACLGVIVSTYVYEALIASGFIAVEAGEYRRIRSKMKETLVTGWVAFDRPTLSSGC